MQKITVHDIILKVDFKNISEVLIVGPLEIVAGFLLIITCVFLIVVITMQEHNSSMSALSGQEQQYNTRNQSKTLDVMLSKATKYAAIVFFVLTLVLNLLVIYIK